MALSLSECTDKERWNRFAGESPHGSVFCLTPFLDALNVEYRLLLVEEREVPQAGLALILRDGQPYPGQHPWTMYQGILLDAGLCRQQPHSRTKQTLVLLDFLLAEF